MTGFSCPGLGAVQANAQEYQEASAQVLSLVLAANAISEDNQILLDQSGDFILEEIVASSTGVFGIKIKLPSGRYLPNTYGRSTNIVGTAVFPVPVTPPVRYIGGSRIAVDVKDLSGAQNTIELMLKGRRVYPTT